MHDTYVLFLDLNLFRIEDLILDEEMGKKCDKENFTSKAAVDMAKRMGDLIRPKLVYRSTSKH